MMTYLLDTQILLWAVTEDPRLSRSVRKVIQNPDNVINVSVASIWEIVIKVAIKKLKYPKLIDSKDILKKSGFKILPITIEHALEVRNLPLYHGDPFDRIIIAQSRVEKCTLITTDRQIRRYALSILKA
jgi:PIN domain nuclease of toxin-antitoxin system